MIMKNKNIYKKNQQIQNLLKIQIIQMKTKIAKKINKTRKLFQKVNINFELFFKKLNK